MFECINKKSKTNKDTYIYEEGQNDDEIYDGLDDDYINPFINSSSMYSKLNKNLIFFLLLITFLKLLF
jgi:hypothetical protein